MSKIPNPKKPEHPDNILAFIDNVGRVTATPYLTTTNVLMIGYQVRTHNDVMVTGTCRADVPISEILFDALAGREIKAPPPMPKPEIDASHYIIMASAYDGDDDGW